MKSREKKIPILLLICALMALPFFPKTSFLVPLFSMEPSGVTQAKVIYREPASWSSFVWINVGKNRAKKGSIAICDGALIGVVEKVERKRSQVRLITDNHLVPSVRVVRGDEKNAYLLRHVAALLDEFPNDETLLKHKEALVAKKGNLYLAKGELMGAALPLWRSRSSHLKGVGFNYDFPDEYGKATGELIKKGDLLVTTGMDGVFPPGLHVAIVTGVSKVVTGGAIYDIEAKAVASSIESLTQVSLLPPLGDTL